MPRFALTIEYDGAPFVGWQRQANGMSVQQRLEEAVFAVDGGHRIVHGAGRTDAGVHAEGQVAHVDLVKGWRADRLRDALNAHLLPDPIAVLVARAVGDAFEARFPPKPDITATPSTIAARRWRWIAAAPGTSSARWTPRRCTPLPRR